MKLETVDMPLFPYQSLTITKDKEELIEEECFKDGSPLPEPSSSLDEIRDCRYAAFSVPIVDTY